MRMFINLLKEMSLYNKMTRPQQNRNKIRQWFITFPTWEKNSVDEKKTIVDQINRLLTKQGQPKLVYFCIAEETHADGQFHYHLVLKLKNGWSKASMLKFFKNRYPQRYKRIDIKAVRSLKASLRYIRKEDTSPWETSGGYVESRNPYNYAQAQILKEWAQMFGYPTIDDYKKSPQWLNFIANPNSVEHFIDQ